MPLFRYQAFNYKGQSISGEVEAGGESEARDILRGKKLIVYSVAKGRALSYVQMASSFFEQGIDTKTRIQFSSQLSVLLKAGVPLLEALNLLSEQFSGKFKRLLQEVKEGVSSGEPLALCLERAKIFSNVYIQLIRGGEESGGLEKVLDRMTSFLERSEDTNKQISKAMMQPIFMMVLIFAIVFGASTFVIPMMAKMLTQTGKDLPPITVAMLAFSDFVKGYWHVGSVAIIAFIVSFTWWKNTENGRYIFHSLLLKTPKVREFIKSYAVVQFSQTLGMLLEAGVNLPKALGIVTNIVDNAILQKSLHEAHEKIVKEGKIAEHLEKTKMFPPVSNYMIKTGEQSGQLAQMLIKVGRDAEVDLVDSTDMLVSSINPIMTVVIGIVVSLLAAAILLPMLSMSDLSGSNF